MHLEDVLYDSLTRLLHPEGELERARETERETFAEVHYLSVHAAQRGIRIASSRKPHAYAVSQRQIQYKK